MSIDRAEEELRRYHETLEEVSSRFFDVAREARRRREDPKPEPEVMLATSIGERVEGLLQVENVADRLEELEKELGDREEATFQIVEEIVEGELKVKGDLPLHERLDYAVRIGLAILTEAVVSAPLEGIASVEIRERGTGHRVIDESDPPHEEPKLVCTECGKEVDPEDCYLAVKYAGPIRAAGGTAAALSVLLADYARRAAGLSRFDPKDFDHDLVGRYVEELLTYLDKVGSFQYNPSEEEVELVAKHVPIEIDGEPTEEEEVQGHRDIPHLPNRLRGGALLVICEGICQKAPKLIKRVKKYGIEGWEFLEELVGGSSDEDDEEEESKRSGVEPNPKYMKDLVAGRPLLSHPSAKGGFRLRYGRARNTGFAAVGVHPSLMYVTKGFIVIGTQLKVERPGKAACVLPVTEIEPPVVRLRDGSVVRLDDPREAKELVERDEVEEVLDLGEMLVAVGEFVENNHPLLPPAYCPEWWVKEVPDVVKVVGLRRNLPKEAFERLKDVPLKRLVKEASRLSGRKGGLDEFLNGPVKVARSIVDLVRKEILPRLRSPERMSVKEAVELSREYGVPFHPKYTFLWHDVEPKDVDRLREPRNVEGSEWGELRVEFDRDDRIKRVLEDLLVPHRVEDDAIVVEEPWASALLAQLGYDPERGEFREEEDEKWLDDLLDYLHVRDETCRYVSKLAGFPVREKAPTRIGARMGRPEKARERRMSPPPHVLFPIGIAGGSQRDIMKFYRGESEDTDQVEVCYRVCPECDRLMPYRVCPICGTETVQYCNRCDEPADECDCEEPDPVVRARIEGGDDPYSSLPVRELVKHAEEEVGTTDKLKGVRGMTSRLKMPEPLQKGILRAKRNLFVFKDGTVRFDCNDCPLTHVRLKEVGLTPFKARLLGFERDVNGDPVVSEDQVVELYPQDVVLPRKAAEWAVRVCQFLDDLLRKYYGLDPVYGVKEPEDLIGHLIVTLAPHTSCGVIGRVVGIADVNCWYNHPIINAARRRNCFPGDTRVLAQVDGVTRRITLRELYELFEDERYENMAHVRRKPKADVKVYSFDPERGEVVLTEIEDVMRAPSPDHLIRFELEHGRSFETTPDHPVLIYENGELVEKRACEVEEGDLVLVPHLELPSKERKHLDLLEELSRRELADLHDRITVHGIADWLRSIGVEPCTDPVPLNILLKALEEREMPVEEVPPCRLGFRRESAKIDRFVPIKPLLRMVGYFLAGGRASRDGTSVTFSVPSEEVREHLESALREVFDDDLDVREENGRIEVRSRFLHLLLTRILEAGEGPHDKRVPPIIFDLPSEDVAEMIKAYLETCGSVSESVPRVSLYGSNETLLEDLETLLISKFGVLGRYRVEEMDGGTVRALEERRTELEPEVSTEVHVLTVEGDHCRKLLEAIGLIEVDDSTTGKPIRNGNSTVGWPVRVRRIEYVPSEEEFVYSLSAERYHNVIVNENVVTHQCDGDEDAFMMLLDVLLNFSRLYLPDKRGGLMDAPLVLTAVVDPHEIDDEVWNMDVCGDYPLELYRKALEYADASEAEELVERLEDRLDLPRGLRFTHDTEAIDLGPTVTRYSRLEKMEDKLEEQLDLARRIRAVDESDVAKIVLDSHFLPDIKGNLRKFGRQKFRCSRCNAKFNVPPLSGKCPRCGGDVLLTIYPATATKYLEPAKQLVKEFGGDDEEWRTIASEVELLEEEAKTLFGSDRRVSLEKFFGET